MKKTRSISETARAARGTAKSPRKIGKSAPRPLRDAGPAKPPGGTKAGAVPKRASGNSAPRKEIRSRPARSGTGRAAKLAAGPTGQTPQARKKLAPVVDAPGDARLLELLARASVVIQDKKGYGLKRFDLRPLYAFTDFLLIATGDSTTQNRAMAAGIEERLRLDFGVRPLGIEGAQSGEWVLLDYGGLVINLFTPAIREHFSLERLWADAAPLADSGQVN